MFDLDRYEYFEDVNLGVVANAPRGARVLDVGCGSGLLGEALRGLGNEVWGIDTAGEVREVAERRLDRFLLGDVTDLGAVETLLGDATFDAIVFADVLEHLYDPVAILKGYRRWLTAGGRVVVSVPNVALWSTRLALLGGHFDYTQTGTLDKTHIRFFTRKMVRRVHEEAGLSVERMDITPGLARPFLPAIKRRMAPHGTVDRRAIIDSAPYRFYARWLYPVEKAACGLAPGLLAFQHIAVSAPTDATAPGARAGTAPAEGAIAGGRP